jgi:hypothetical protein
LLKLVLDEAGADVAGVAWDEVSRPVSSRLVYAEGRAALALARRLGRLTTGYRTAVGSFRSVYSALEAVDVSEDIVLRAGDLAERHELRGYDAVHLASALETLSAGTPLVTWDEDLSRAARTEGLAVIP